MLSFGVKKGLLLNLRAASAARVSSAGAGIRLTRNAGVL